MEYGLIGEKLSHSYSKEIHERLWDYTYEIKELTQEQVEEFVKTKNYKGINVTIPYKETVIPYLDEISNEAKKIGSVNTIVNRDGVLYGYNTDYFGFKSLLEKNKIEIENKKILILGSGGTSKTVYAVVSDMKAKCIKIVSRTKKETTILYSEAKDKCSDYEILINTTPCGMYPNVDNTPIDLNCFSNLECVVDVVYNPLQTKLTQKAKQVGIKAVNGLYMLVAQAVNACELFTGNSFSEDKTDQIYKDIVLQKRNIVLIGMPGSGKTTMGRLLAQKNNIPFFDTDLLIEEKMNMSVSDIINTYGEERFRKIESKIINEVSIKNSSVIATGGGVILKKENVDSLKLNGKLLYIKKDIEDLFANKNRPLIKKDGDLTVLYNSRKELYENYADSIVQCTKNIEDNILSIEKECLI